MTSQMDRNASKSPRAVRRRRASMAASRQLRLEPLERRCPFDAAGFGSVMGPMDYSADLLSVEVAVPPSVVAVMSDAAPSSIELFGPTYPQPVMELPMQQDDLGTGGDAKGGSEPNEEAPHSEDKSTETPLIGNDAGLTQSGDAAIPGSGEAVDQMIGENDGNKKDLDGIVTAIKLERFAPLQGPSGSISLDQDNLPDREPSATGSVAASRNRAVSNAGLTIEVDAETPPKPRSEVSLTKTRYFEKASSGTLQESSLQGFRRQATTLRMFARQAIPDDAGISIGSSSADQNRRRFASWNSKSSLQVNEPPDDATSPAVGAVAIKDANADRAIMEWVSTSIGMDKSLTSLSPTLSVVGLIDVDTIPTEIASSDGEEANGEDKAIALSDVTRNLGRFAVLGMLVSHGISWKVRRRVQSASLSYP